MGMDGGHGRLPLPLGNYISDITPKCKQNSIFGQNSRNNPQILETNIV